MSRRLPFLAVGTTLQWAGKPVETIVSAIPTRTDTFGEGRNYQTETGAPFAHLWLEIQIGAGRCKVVELVAAEEDVIDSLVRSLAKVVVTPGTEGQPTKVELFDQKAERFRAENDARRELRRWPVDPTDGAYDSRMLAGLSILVESGEAVIVPQGRGSLYVGTESLKAPLFSRRGGGYMDSAYYTPGRPANLYDEYGFFLGTEGESFAAEAA